MASQLLTYTFVKTFPISEFNVGYIHFFLISLKVKISKSFRLAQRSRKSNGILFEPKLSENIFIKQQKELKKCFVHCVCDDLFFSSV